MASSAAPVARVFITPTVSSKPSRRAFGLKVGYASSRAHNNSGSNTNLNTNHSNNYNNNNIFARAGQQRRPVARVLAFHTLKLKHGFKRYTCCSCFHNSNGVLETIVQGVRIECGLCEFAHAQQQRHQH
jgi:hypothetical protein